MPRRVEGLAADRPGVRNCFRELAGVGRGPPPGVRVLEELHVVGHVPHAQDRVETVVAGPRTGPIPASAIA